MNDESAQLAGTQHSGFQIQESVYGVTILTPEFRVLNSVPIDKRRRAAVKVNPANPSKTRVNKRGT